MRDPVSVLKAIKNHIPESMVEEKKRCDWFINDFSYKPPEMWVYCFRQMTQFVNEDLILLSNPVEDWQVKVCSILCCVSEDEIRKRASL